jgi:formylglycine-generating enzyme required for sulfatase activity
MTFSFIPPGSFLMGSPPQEEGRNEAEEGRHRVELTRGFWLSICPVTQAQWLVVMGDDPSYFKGHDRPVEQVSWHDCSAFCQRVGEQVGEQGRLPTEAEWEYACRAGTTTAYYTGDGLAALKRAGWCSYDGETLSAEQTRPVGQFEPNAWGLYDLHGNVFEWVADWFAVYPEGDVTDPFSGGGGTFRVLRGGCWGNAPEDCRSAYRGKSLYFPEGNDSERSHYLGFRVLLCPREAG